MTEPVRLMTVCTGNVCRSPYLERRLQQEMDRAWGPGSVEVRSAGTGALVDAAMDPQSLSLLEARGGAGEDFRARQLSKEQLANQQLVIVAARDHRKTVTRLWPKGLARTHALLDLAQLASLIRDDELPQRSDARSWFEAVVPLIASKRGLQMPMPEDQAEVVDPFRQGPETFQRMQQQIEDALPQVLRVFGA